MPPLVHKKLEDLQAKYGSGSVISILGFNDFNLGGPRSRDDAIDEIFRAVARNFFIRILDGKLHVTCDGKEMTPEHLESVMLNGKSQKRRKSELQAISGSKSYSDYVTIKKKKEVIETEYGNFDLYYRQATPDESIRISLYRQGMYITDSITRNTPAIYGKYKPFSAVISIDTSSNRLNEAFQLIRGAEGPKHLEINAMRLLDAHRTKFFDFFEQVQEQIRMRCVEDSTEELVPSIFDFVFDGEKQISPNPSTKTDARKDSHELTAVDEATHGFGAGEQGAGSEGGGKTERKDRHLVRSRCAIKVAAKRDKDCIQLIIKAEKNIKDARLYLGIHSGSDATCSSPLNDQPIKFKIVSRDGKTIDSKGAKSKGVGSIERGKPKSISLKLLDEVHNDAVIKVSVDDHGVAAG